MKYGITVNNLYLSYIVLNNYDGDISISFSSDIGDANCYNEKQINNVVSIVKLYFENVNTFTTFEEVSDE